MIHNIMSIVHKTYNTVLMCVSQLTSCDHSEVKEILDLLGQRYFREQSIAHRGRSKQTVSKNVREIFDQTHETEKLLRITSLIGCEYVARSLEILDHYSKVINICLKTKHEKNKGTTIECMKNLKSFGTEANNMITYFISALDYLQNLLRGDYTNNFFQKYIFELKKVEQIESTLPENKAVYTRTDEEVIINYGDISKIKDKINFLFDTINLWNYQKCSFWYDEGIGFKVDNRVSDEKSSSKEVSVENLSFEIILYNDKYSENMKKLCNKLIVKYYNILGFKYDTEKNETIYDIEM
ncbi:uncharacterized protein LOC126894425 [Daktulosphaira vitifoliae]|uniref:uncharacterized protein LOC126894425 n=1 Tax=Daktulosphaira vitifoliae TaxID=58002 RepID=UPI0021AA267A|nr:uncharacterized protein LOC126894425 [Daktulosphaira vitifoliae]